MNLDKEEKICHLMIDIYCKKKHKNNDCQECKELKEYVSYRLSKCPFKENKTFCANCKIHCYKNDMRDKIKEVMRFSGPRMMFYHPVLAMKHLIETRKEKLNDKK